MSQSQLCSRVDCHIMREHTEADHRTPRSTSLKDLMLLPAHSLIRDPDYGFVHVVFNLTGETRCHQRPDANWHLLRLREATDQHQACPVCATEPETDQL